MKILLAVSWLSVLSSSWLVVHAKLGAGSSSTDDSCSVNTAKNTCQQAIDHDSNSPCVWCESQAVASGCFTKDQSEMLPASVFHCESPGHGRDMGNDDQERGFTRTSFNFLENAKKPEQHGDSFNNKATHHLLHKVHQPGNDAICDGSSKSIR